MHEQVYEHLKLDDKFPFAYFTTSDRQAFFHYHDCLELNIVEEGSGYYIINGKKYDISKGDIFVINNKDLTWQYTIRISGSGLLFLI